jgi:hypothetical protein
MKHPDLKPATTLSPEEVAELLPNIGFVESWCKDVKTLALQMAEHGTPVPGYKLVAGRSVRRWQDPDEVKQTLMAHGLHAEQFVATKLAGVTAVEKLLGGKKIAAPIMNRLTIKPQGKPTLVPDSDKRDVIASSAESDFK